MCKQTVCTRIKLWLLIELTPSQSFSILFTHERVPFTGMEDNDGLPAWLHLQSSPGLAADAHVHHQTALKSPPELSVGRQLSDVQGLLRGKQVVRGFCCPKST